MKKVLYSNGCSWTNGDGIEHDPSLSPFHEDEKLKFRKTKNWASHLSQLLNYDECINHAAGAGSNKRMVRTTCDYIQSLNPAEYNNHLIVLGWTTVDRNELLLDDGNNRQWCIFNATQKISSHSPPFDDFYLREVDKIQEKYMKYIFNSRMNYTYFLQEMFFMSNLLENLGIKYLFFSSLPWRRYATDTTGNVENEFKIQISHLKKPMILNTRDCDDRFNVMSDFCRLNNIPMAPDHHTMIEGHARWAEHLYNELKGFYGNQL